MSKTRDTGFLANVIQVHDTGVRIMSGSEMLMAISSSGAVTITGELSGSDAANSLLLDGTGSLAFTTTASYNAFSASYGIASASLSSRTTQVERTYATTGSNTFTGAQYISDTSNAIGFTSTASLYSDGGLRVQGNSFVSGTAYFNNIVVYGTSSIQYVTSSQVNIGSNIITVNTDTPAIRFGGLSVFDSGSTQLTGSIFWDSEKNHWIYSNASGSGGGATYAGGMFISGPRSSVLGSEQGTTACMLLVGQGGDHLTSSMIYHDSANTCFYTNATLVCSNNFGSNLNSRQTFTGSFYHTGSVAIFNSAIGIGTVPDTNQSPVLHAYNSSAATRIRLQYYSGSAGAIDFYSGSTANWSIVVDNNQAYGKIENRFVAGDAIRFYNSTNNVILNATAGCVGIGTTSLTAAKLTIGGVTLNQSTSALDINAAGSGTYQRGIRVLNSSMTCNDGILIQVGKSDDLLNAGQMTFNYLGNSSTSNYIEFGLYACDKILNIVGNGRVGLGLINPDTQLHSRSASQINAIKSESTHASGYGLFQSKNSTSGLWQSGAWPDNTYRIGLSGVADYFSINADGGVRVIGGSLAIRNSGNSITYGLMLRAGAWLGDATADFGLAAETGYNIRFYTDGSATERLRLTTAGQLQSYVSMKVQSGTGGSSAGLIVRPADNTDESTFFGKESYWTLIGANSNEGWKFRGSNGANAFLVNAGSFSYNATLLGSLTQNASDIRLKTDIVKIENALEKINTLEGFTYNWNEECPLYNPNSTTKEVGVSAQAVKDILPEVVSLAGFDRDNDDQTKSKSGENYLTIQYEKLVPLLIEGIKELKAEFEEYKATHP
jgi:hypothetical protein